jgi:hypothetical protein
MGSSFQRSNVFEGLTLIAQSSRILARTEAKAWTQLDGSSLCFSDITSLIAVTFSRWRRNTRPTQWWCFGQALANTVLYTHDVFRVHSCSYGRLFRIPWICGTSTWLVKRNWWKWLPSDNFSVESLDGALIVLGAKRASIDMLYLLFFTPWVSLDSCISECQTNRQWGRLAFN